MIQPAPDSYLFYSGPSHYRRATIIGWLLLAALLAGALLSFWAGTQMWGSYSHQFTPYLKWQDAVAALFWSITFLMLGGSIFVVRFLHALHTGFTQGMITLVGTESLAVRDLSTENFASIVWIMHAAFWCFVAALVGLLPEMLIGWTLHLSPPVLAVLATGVTILLSLAGLVVTIIALSFIAVGCIGLVSSCRKLGALHIYQLSNHTVLRIDNFVLTIIYPGVPETMIDLKLLTAEDQRLLLSLLRARWIDVQHVWNPTLGEEIEEAEKFLVLA